MKIVVMWMAIVGFVALGLALVEVLARVGLRRFGRYHVLMPHQRTLMHIDREALPDLEPAARVEINADGERGDPPPRRAGSTFRVLVAGGSGVEGYYLDQDRTWPAVVQRVLGRSDHLRRLGKEAVHVGNIGRSLVTCQDVAQMVERHLERRDPVDAIVLMVGASDVITWLQQGTPDTFDEPPRPAAELFAFHPQGPFGWTLRRMALRRLAALAWRRWRRPVDVRERVGRRLIRLRAMRAAATRMLDQTPDPEPMLANFERHFRRLLSVSQTKARHVIVVRQPWLEKPLSDEEKARLWNFAAGRPFEGPVDTYYSLPVAWALLARMDERAERIAKELGIVQLDRSWVEHSFDAFYDLMHPTPKGCELVGQAVARRILDAVEGRDGLTVVGAAGEAPPRAVGRQRDEAPRPLASASIEG